MSPVVVLMLFFINCVVFCLVYQLWHMSRMASGKTSQDSTSAEIVYGRKTLLFGKPLVASTKRERWLNENMSLAPRQTEEYVPGVSGGWTVKQVGRKDSREKEESVTGYLQEGYRTAYPMGSRSIPVPQQAPTETPAYLRRIYVDRWFEEQCKRLKTLADHGLLNREQLNVEYSKILIFREAILMGSRCVKSWWTERGG